MSKKTTQKPKASTPTRRSYDLDQILGTQRGAFGARDELDDILAQGRRMQAQKLKSMQVEKISLELQKDVDKLRKETSTSPSGQVSPQELAQYTAIISQMPEEQRPVAIQALTAFRQTSDSSMGNLGPLLMVSMLQKKPDTSVTDLVGALKSLNDIQGGREPKWGNMEGILAISKMLGDSKDIAYQTQIQMLRQQIEDIRPHDPIEYQKSLLDIARGFGMKPDSGEVNVELEKIKMDHANMLQKTSQEFELLLRKMDRDDARMDALVKTLAPAVTAFAQAGSTRIAGNQQNSIPLMCPQCSFSPIFVARNNPVAPCPQCGTTVTTQEHAQRMGIQQPDETRGPPPPPTGPSPPGPPRPPGA